MMVEHQMRGLDFHGVPHARMKGAQPLSSFRGWDFKLMKDTVTISIDRFKSLENKESILNEIQKSSKVILRVNYRCGAEILVIDENTALAELKELISEQRERINILETENLSLKSSVRYLNQDIHDLKYRTFWERVFNK